MLIRLKTGVYCSISQSDMASVVQSGAKLTGEHFNNLLR